MKVSVVGAPRARHHLDAAQILRGLHAGARRDEHHAGIASTSVPIQLNRRASYLAVSGRSS